MQPVATPFPHPRSECEIGRDLAQQIEVIVHGFEEQVARDAAEEADTQAACFFKNWSVL